MKRKIIVAVICVIMATVSLRYLVPIFRLFSADSIRDITESGPGPVATDQLTETEKPELTQLPSSQLDQSNPKDDQSYDAWYQGLDDQVTDSKIKERRKRKKENFQTIYDRDRANNSGSTLVSTRDGNILLTVERACFSQKKPELSGDMSHFREGTSNHSYDFEYLLIDVKIENTTDHDVSEVSLNTFSALLVNENLTIYRGEQLYSTYQPGKYTHIYFQSKLAPGEVIKSTLVFYVPVDEQFDDYGVYLLINQTGSAVYDPQMCGLLPLSPERSAKYEEPNKDRD